MSAVTCSNCNYHHRPSEYPPVYICDKCYSLGVRFCCYCDPNFNPNDDFICSGCNISTRVKPTPIVEFEDRKTEYS